MSTTPQAIAPEVPKEVIQIQPQGGPLPSSVYKDEGRDVTGDALARAQAEEAAEQGLPAAAPPAPPAEQPPAEQSAPASKKQLTKEEYEAILDAEAPELINGKYKTLRESNKAYVESQKGFMSKVQEEAKKQAAQLAESQVKEILTEKLKSLVTVNESTVQTAQAVEKSFSELTPDEHLDMLTKNPAEYQKRVIEESTRNTLRLIKAGEMERQWRNENKDLLEAEIVPGDDGRKPVTGEFLVSALTLALAKENPDKLNDGGDSLIHEATGHVRNLFSALRNQGKQEATVVRETVAPLQATAQSTASGDNRSTQDAPAKPIDPLQDEVDRLRAEHRRNTGGQPVVRW